MRLRHFCIGSIRTQDLLISKSFLPTSASQDVGGEMTDIQAVWAKFLDLFQNELRWTTSASQLSHSQQGSRSPNAARSPPLHSSSPHSSSGGPKARGTTGPGLSGGGGRSGSGMASARADSPHFSHSPPLTNSSGLITTITGELHSVAIPLFSSECCYIYQTIHDLVLVACCPLPPTPTTASATVTRIPFSLPGQRGQPSLSRGSSVPGSPGGSSLLDSQEPLRQRPVPELAFSTAVGLHTSYHGTVEFLGQLIVVLERYLVPSQLGALRGASGAGGRPGAVGVAHTNSKAGSASSTTLSAELVQLNTGIVYEILEECMSMGYPMIPSLAQLDLLIFGVPKTAS